MVELVVCGKCVVPMTHKMSVCYNNAVIFHGDEFTCPSCDRLCSNHIATRYRHTIFIKTVVP